VRAAALAFFVLACSARDEQVPRSSAVFGDDRVADALARDPARAPRTFVEHEALFGVGRACTRADSHEVYIIEENATRFAEAMIPTATPVPRAIVTGCNPKPESLDGVAVSFGLMTVMPTDPSRLGPDPLARAPVEAMALDRTTGLYNFYVFDDAGVQRIVREGSVVKTIVGGRDGTVTTRTETSPRCFGCHVHGGPLMAALADPWTSWVSTRDEEPGGYSGETAAIVAESNQLKTSKRAAFANALEGVMRNAIRSFVVSGLGPRTDVRTLLRSVFCETELQWASTFDTVPLQIVVDPAAAAGSGLTRPIATDNFPQLLPIRSEIDLKIEDYLVSTGVLSESTVRAIRLIDDANDIFSDKRCALYPRAVQNPTDAAIRTLVREATNDYGRAILDGRDDGGAYFTGLRARVANELANRALLEARLAARRARARAMFPGPMHPLPIGAVSE
jgi:hypothetical protein